MIDKISDIIILVQGLPPSKYDMLLTIIIRTKRMRPGQPPEELKAVLSPPELQTSTPHPIPNLPVFRITVAQTKPVRNINMFGQETVVVGHYHTELQDFCKVCLRISAARIGMSLKKKLKGFVCFPHPLLDCMSIFYYLECKVMSRLSISEEFFGSSFNGKISS